MKKILTQLMILLVCLSFLTACASKTDKLISEIEKLNSDERITQEKLDSMFESYESLSAEDKKLISNYSTLAKYKGVTIDKVYSVQDSINAINDSTSFTEIVTIQSNYDALNDYERNLINATILKEKFELNDLEKAALTAAKCIKNSLKNKSSLVITESKVINDLDGTSGYYLVSTHYSATNSFGGRIDDASLQTINKNFENPWYSLAMLTGKYETALECQPYQSTYLLHHKEPTHINIDKLEYHLANQ